MFTCVRSRMSKNMVYVHVYVYVRVVGSRESRVGSATASAFPSGLLVSVLEVGLRCFSSDVLANLLLVLRSVFLQDSVLHIIDKNGTLRQVRIL